MKKSLFFGIIAILCIIGCSRKQEIDVLDSNLSIFARTESPAETKTVVESGVHVYWEPGDEIVVFMDDQSAKFTTDITAASGTATFKGTFGDTTWPEELDLWAVYPFSEDALFDGETITTTLPSEQVAREGSFGKDMNLAIAHSNSSTLQFYNVGGGIRFSVTEEGIKKVMFEGLSGEIISGKVKIGFEDGIPVVKEVAGGSQFITLLPPSGKEAFEKDTWYYIVAIPGALEGGYKLRFYKDSDYARKVSEKAAMIKRSIYGIIEKADEGIEYEAQTTHFPETEEDWDKSISLTEEIGKTVASYLHALSSASLDDIKIIEEQIRRIDGIEEVIMNTEEKAFSIMQKDSIWVNYYSPHSSNGFEMPSDHSALANSISTSQSSQAIRRSHISSRNNSYNNPDEDYYINFKRKAVFLVPPFVYNANANISDIADCLVRAGFPKSNILIKDKASDFTSPFSSDILQFKGSNISNYDFIFIRTHGGTGYYAKKPEGERIENTTILFSSTKYDKKTVKKIVDDGQLLWSDVAIGALDENEDGVIDGYYLCMTPSFLKGAQYENSCVIITACSSARILVNGNGGSMIQTFLDQKAGIVSGYTGTTMDYMDVPLSVNLVCLMSNGLSFQDAIKYIQNSVVVNQYYQQVKNYYLENYEKLGYSNDDLVWLPLSVNPRNFHYEPVTLSRPYLLLDPYPILNEVTPVNGDCLLSWESDLTPFDFDWPILSSGEVIGNTIRSLTVHFEVYLDDVKLDKSIYSDDTEKKVSCSLSSGEHKWYVIAKIMEDDTIIASYQSSIGKFTVDKVGEAIIEILDEDYATYCPVGRNKSASFTIRNNGDAALVISDVYFNDDDMTASFNWTTATINPNESKDLVVTFSPLNTGPHRPSINIYSNASNPNYSYSVRMNYFSFDCYGQHAIPSYSDEMVDLGLSVKWAACDLGTSTILDYGEHYAWGETDRKSSYSWDNYKWCNGSEETITKYTYYEGPFTLDSADDAATVHLGEGWRMPTQEECQELIDNCQWRATEKDGVSVFEVTSRKNGNKIYFMRWSSAVGMLSDYWANSLWSDDGAYDFALCWYGYSEDCNPMLCGMGKAYGALIRPVYQGNSGGSSQDSPSVSISATSMDFGSVPIGYISGKQTVSITNKGNSNLNVKVRSCTDGFYVSPEVGSSFTLAPGKTRSDISVNFEPYEERYYSGSVVFTTNDPNHPTVSISVMGSGYEEQEANPSIRISEDIIRFDTVSVGSSRTKTIYVTNTGDSDLHVNTVKLLNGDEGFSLSGWGNQNKTISPGESASLSITFSPSVIGDAQDQILIKSDAFNTSHTLVYLYGTGN